MMSDFQSFDQCFLSSRSPSEKESFSLKEPFFLDAQAGIGNQGWKVECMREEDTIQGIRIICECGQELYLECEYKKNKT